MSESLIYMLGKKLMDIGNDAWVSTPIYNFGKFSLNFEIKYDYVKVIFNSGDDTQNYASQSTFILPWVTENLIQVKVSDKKWFQILKVLYSNIKQSKTL